MQSLYALETEKLAQANGEVNAVYEDTELPAIKAKGLKLLNEKFDQSAMLFTLMMSYITRIAQYAEVDAKFRASKYLATEQDKNVNTKIAGNEYVWAILENETFKDKLASLNIENYIDPDYIKSLYAELVKSDAYLQYIEEEGRNTASDKAIITYIWATLLYGSEDFNNYILDEFEYWEDDKDMINILIENFIKQKRAPNFLSFVSSEKKEYAVSLLNTVLEKEAFLMEQVVPKLKNWDPERVAQIDMIALKMGVAEFLYFPTIPTKVTINEYIEVAKLYSTMQSGQFVNGVLDNILKTLNEQNKIRKVARS